MHGQRLTTYIHKSPKHKHRCVSTMKMYSQRLSTYRHESPKHWCVDTMKMYGQRLWTYRHKFPNTNTEVSAPWRCIVRACGHTDTKAQTLMCQHHEDACQHHEDAWSEPVDIQAQKFQTRKCQHHDWWRCKIRDCGPSSSSKVSHGRPNDVRAPGLQDDAVDKQTQIAIN